MRFGIEEDPLDYQSFPITATELKKIKKQGAA
jgi:hypothetical protein